MAHLGGIELDGIVDGSDKKPTLAPENWIKSDKLAKSMIFSALDMKQIKEVAGCQTAKEVWDKLKALYGQTSKSHITNLLHKFFSLTMQEGQSMKDYVTEVEFIALQLSSAGQKMGDNFLIAKLLSGSRRVLIFQLRMGLNCC